jgi:iron complex outermembrane receptor protein
LSELSLEAIMMKKLLRLATVALLFTGVASAQSTGSITGVVTDGASGKPVVGALVVATSPAVPGQQTAVTDAKGAFTVGGLPAGQYKLQASFDGYKPETRADLAVGENVALRANLAIVPEAVQMEEVVVTGSRIKRKDLTMAAPVTVVSKEQMNAQGKVSLSEFIQAMPEQQGGLNAQVNNGTDGSTSIDLRNLGAQRTLVLVNGRRFVGGPATNITDLGAIPAAAVERVEILKDGASAVYGSDAIAGVVNVILKKRFNGTEISGYVGNSSRNDGSQADVSFITGTGNEKGNFLFSLGYTKMEPIRSRDRKFAETTYGWGPFDGTGDPGWYAGGNSTTFPNGRFTLPAAACVAPTTAQAIQACTDTGGGGATVPFPTGASTANYQSYDGSLFNTNTTNYLITPSQKIQIFTTGDGNLGNVARAYFEASYNKRNSAYTLAPMPLISNTIPTAPVYVSANSLYNPFGVEITSWRKRTEEFGDRYWKDEATTFRTVVGLDGSLGDWAGPLKGWGWDASYNYGATTFNELSTGQLRMPNVANATGPSMLDAGGNPVCVRVAGQLSTKIAGCVPMDVLHGNGNMPGLIPPGGSYAGQLAALKNYVSFDGTNRGTSDQQILSASLSGEMFRLLSDRPTGLALGVDRRYEAGTYTPDVITQALESSGNNQLATAGSFSVTEAFAELQLPIVNKLPFMEELEVQLAARTVNYSNFGNNATYKAGARYTPVKDITIRGTYSTALRAPNVSELFGGAADNYPTVRDPCRALTPTSSAALVTNCTAAGVPYDITTKTGGTGDNSSQILTKQGGNADLKPETAKIMTAGLVIEPRWVPNLSITVDYYVITVDKAISLFGASNVLNQCYVQGNSAYCGQVHRDPGANFAVINLDDKIANLAKDETAGVDVAARYVFPTESIGKFSIGADATFLSYHNYIDATGFKIRGKGNDDIGPLPAVKGIANLGWSMGGLNVGVNARYVGGFKECYSDYCMFNPPNTPADQIKIPSYTTVSLNAGYTFKTSAGTTTWIAGVQNVADTQPPFLYFASAANTDPYLYDYIGRYFYTRLTQTF